MRTQLKGTLAVALATILVGSAVLTGAALGGVPGTSTTQQQEAGQQQQVTQDTAYVRAFHASPDAPAVDVLVDNETVVSGLEFGEATQYLQIEGGEHRLTIQTAENGTVVYDSNVTIEPRSVTTIAASGEVSEDAEQPFAPLFIRDDAFTPADDEAAVAVAHLSPDAGTVDVTLADSGDVVVDNASYGTVSDYTTLPAGEYTLEIRAGSEDNDGEVLYTVNATVEGGEAYTAYAVGNVNASEGSNAFEVALTQDATHSVQIPSATSENATETPSDNATETATETPSDEATTTAAETTGEESAENVTTTANATETTTAAGDA